MENLSANHAQLGEFKYPLIRSKLRAWLVLEDFYSNIIEAAGLRNRKKFVSSIYSYVSAALCIPQDTLSSCPWYEVTRTFRQIFEVNRPSFNFPVLYRRKEKQITQTEGWEYPGRDWFEWLHLLAKEYGWLEEYIANLDIDVGIALFQEIMIDEQLQKEWEWSRTEVAYSYNEATKSSKFVPLERPNWMRPIPKPIKKIKIKASRLPVGLIMRWDTDTNAYTRPQ